MEGAFQIMGHDCMWYNLPVVKQTKYDGEMVAEEDIGVDF